MLKKKIAILMALVMMLSVIAVANAAPTAQGDYNAQFTTSAPDIAPRSAPGGDALRATLINADASVQFTGDFTAGNEYTLSFWFRNATGRNSVSVQWSHWPENNEVINTAHDYTSAAGEWVYHEIPFVVPPEYNTDIQIAPDARASGDTFYVTHVIITSAAGTEQVIPLTSLRGHWGTDVITVAIVPIGGGDGDGDGDGDEPPGLGDYLEPLILTPFHSYDTVMMRGETFSWDVPISNTTIYPYMDIMLLVDTTGTMHAMLPMVLGALQQFTEDLLTAGASDIRFGVAYYGDRDADRTPAHGWFGITLPVGNHSLEEVQNAIRTLPRLAGGDAPEDHLWSIMRVADETEWRPDAQRLIIQVQDDMPSKVRPDETVGGLAVTFENAPILMARHRIQSIFMHYPLTTTRLNDVPNALGVEAYLWRNQAELEEQLHASLMGREGELGDFEVEVRTSVTYLSDGTFSPDIEFSVNPESAFELLAGASRTVSFTAIARSLIPEARGEDERVRVEVGFYLNGVRIAAADQELLVRILQPRTDFFDAVGRVDRGPIIPFPPLNRSAPSLVEVWANEDTVEVIGWIALDRLALTIPTNPRTTISALIEEAIDDVVSFDLSALPEVNTVIIPRTALRTFANAGLTLEFVTDEGVAVVDPAREFHMSSLSHVAITVDFQ